MKKVYIVVACHVDNENKIDNRFNLMARESLEKAKIVIKDYKETDKYNGDTNWFYYIDEMTIY